MRQSKLDENLQNILEILEKNLISLYMPKVVLTAN